MNSPATPSAQCPYTASTCPLLAPFAVNPGETGGFDGAPSASACASAHASPAPGTIAPDQRPTYSNQHQQHQRYDDRPYVSSQVMLSGPTDEPSYGGGYDGSAAPTVPIHRARPSNLSGRPADRSHQGPSSSSCQPGQCSTPDTCNPSGQSQAVPSLRSASINQQQWAYDDAQQQRRPGPGRFASADSTLTQATTNSSDYSNLGGGGPFDGQQGGTPSSDLMHSAAIQPVHLQRPVFGAPSPYQTSEYGYNDDGRSSYPSLSGYSFPLPSPLPDLMPPSPQAHGQQPQETQRRPPTQQSYRQPPPTKQPSYGSYGTCDVEDLVGGRAYHAQQQAEQKPNLGRLDAIYGPSPILPPLVARRSGPSVYTAPPPVLPVQPFPPASITAIEDAPADAASSGEQTAFISKLWHLLTHAEYERYLRWNKAGDAFILTNGNEFAMKVLPRFFRHSNQASFVRQLNLYQFSRVSTIHLLDMTDASTSTSIVPQDQSSAPDHAHHVHGDSDSDTASSHSGEGAGHAGPVEGSIAASGFSHPNFLRGRPDLLKLLKPRGTSKKSTASKKASMAVAAEKAKGSAGGSRRGK